MSEFTFTKVPSNAAVASFVTLLVCAWFTAAAVAIAAEQPVERMTRAKPTTQQVQAPVIAPREVITVVAQRETVIAPREVITVFAKRSTAGVS